MKKKFTLFCAAFIACINLMAADDLVFLMTEDSPVEIVNGGVYDAINKCIGNTMTGTIIYLGEIDFGNGNTYFASGVEIANESTDLTSSIDFYMGHPDEEGSIMFNDVEIHATSAWQYYRTFRYNFYPEDELIPVGKQKIYLRFKDGVNLKKAIFYGKELLDTEQGEQPDPKYNALKISSSQGEKIDPDGNYPDARYDPETDAYRWGGNGLILKFSGIDFKDGNLYKQLAVVTSHGGTSVATCLEIYIDSPEESNQIANIWTGRDYFWRVFAPHAANIEKTISGVHDVYVKWTGSTDLRELQIIEGTPWTDIDGAPEIPTYIDVELTEPNYQIKFDELGAYPNEMEFIHRGISDGGAGARFESANIGYTSGGVVLKFKDVDLTGYKRIVVDHSSDQAKLRNAFFDFYIDLPYEIEAYEDITFLEDEDVEPVARVVAQGTAGWGDNKKVPADLTLTEGVHDLYMVFNFNPAEVGANIYGIYLDNKEDDTGIDPVTTKETIRVLSRKGAIELTSYNEINSVIIYSLSGACIKQYNNPSNNPVIPMQKGIYIVKATDNEGNSVAKKAVVF